MSGIGVIRSWFSPEIVYGVGDRKVEHNREYVYTLRHCSDEGFWLQEPVYSFVNLVKSNRKRFTVERKTVCRGMISTKRYTIIDKNTGEEFWVERTGSYYKGSENIWWVEHDALEWAVRVLEGFYVSLGLWIKDLKAQQDEKRLMKTYYRGENQ